MNEIYAYALKLLRGRDYTISKLCAKLEAKFGSVPPEVIEQLLEKKFLNDRRFAENYIASGSPAELNRFEKNCWPSGSRRNWRKKSSLTQSGPRFRTPS